MIIYHKFGEKIVLSYPDSRHRVSLCMCICVPVRMCVCMCGSVGYVRMAWVWESDDRLAHEFHVQLRISSSWTFDLAKIPSQSKQWKNLSHLGHTHAHIFALAFSFSFYHVASSVKKKKPLKKDPLVTNLKWNDGAKISSSFLYKAMIQANNLAHP